MAYLTPRATREQIKEAVFRSIAPGETPCRVGREREMYRIRGRKVHARYSARNYKFNLNPNTLRADFELWICGSCEHWYLIPIDVIRYMYEQPAAYRDNTHTEIRFVAVDGSAHRVEYAASRLSLSLAPYFRATLGGG
jgi:hypothetical protein